MIQVEVIDLFYAYPGDKQAVLKGLNFETQKGEIFGFLGPSGAGNSTTRKIIYKILNGFERNTP